MSATTGYWQDFHDSSSRDWRLVYPDVGLDLWRAPRREIHVRGEIPRWWAQVVPRLGELLQLRQDWDPRGSRPISRDDLEDAVRFLIRVMRPDTLVPWIGPLASGGVELAWRAGNVEVEAIFDRARGERELLVSVGGNESEAPIDHGESLFAEVVERLSAGDLVAA